MIIHKEKVEISPSPLWGEGRDEGFDNNIYYTPSPEMLLISAFSLRGRGNNYASITFYLIFSITLLFLTACTQIKYIGQPPEMTAGFASIPHVKPPETRMIATRSKENSSYADENAICNDDTETCTSLPSHASLWRSGPESLFGDRRAREMGDILTVEIEIDDRAEFNNKTETKKDSENNSSIEAGFGIDTLVDKVLPSPLSVKPGLITKGAHSLAGEGKINRRERIKLKIAAIVRNILPNGNMVIQGSQEVNVNNELRDLQITGVVRPHDISRRNTISYEKIAEARIYYGGRGQASSAQQPNYGTEFFDIISPF